MKGQLLDFESDDTEGSDLSYESSFDERLDVENQQINQQKGISQFKDQMHRFLMQNPEINDNLKLEKANFQDEEELRQLFPVQQNNLNQVSSPGRKIIFAPSPRAKSQPRPQSMGKWEGLSANVLNQAKKLGTLPSLEEFQQRLNLFRRKVEKSDVVDLIIAEQDKLLKDIALQAKRNKARDSALHEQIEAKVRKETGNIGYISYRKRIQFQFRIKKAEEMAQEKVEKQQKQKDIEMKKSKGIFEKLFNERKNYEKQDDGDQLPIESEFKSQAAEELYRKIKKCNDDTEIKSTIIQFIIQHRKKLADEYWNKPSLLQQGAKFYSEESKEFTLLAPNFQFKKQIQGQVTRDFFEKKDNLEEGNIYLLTKVNKLLDGHLMKYWKSIQETQI